MPQNKLYKIIKGDDILKVTDQVKVPLIEGMLFRKDYIMIVAEEKMGKTILSQQLAASLSSGTPFLGVFDIPKPCKVWYMATEGRPEDLQDRFIRINNKITINTNNISLIPTVFRFNTPEGLESLTSIIEELKDDKPDVIIVDALYRAIKGSLKADEVVNDFHHVIGLMSSQLSCAVILVHHMTKPQKDHQGNKFQRSDKDMFGSAFLSAAVDHVFWLEKWHKGDNDKDRILKCDTQRSGDIVSNIRLRLKEPDPLYFEVVSTNFEDKTKVIKILENCPNGASMHDLEFKTRISRSKLYTIMGELMIDGAGDFKIVKIGSKIKYYTLVPN